MKFSIPCDQFVASLGVAARGVSTRSAIQTLSGVLVRAEDGQVELLATDMELGIRVSTSAQTEREGEAVVPGRLLLDVVRSLPKDEMSLEYRSSQQDVEVVSGTAKFHLRTLPLEDFPKLPEPNGSTMRVPSRRLRGDDQPRRPLGLAGRDAPSPDRRARVGVGQGAAHGRHGLVSAVGQGDVARAAARRRARGERAGAHAAGARPCRGHRRRRARSRSPRSRTR